MLLKLLLHQLMILTTMRRFKRSHKGPVNASKVTFDGVLFASSLEVYCYQQLKKHKLFEHYESEKFTTIEGATSSIRTYERQSNGKGEFKERGYGKKVLGISYKPDFTGRDFIIEVKGRPNESFPLRWKLFKLHQIATGDNRTIYKPQNKKEIDECIQLIIQHRNGQE